MSKYIGDVTHGEKFTNKDGEEKTKWTKVGGLFYDDTKDRYSVKFLGQWLNVFPPNPKEDVVDNSLDTDETFGDKSEVIPF